MTHDQEMRLTGFMLRIASMLHVATNMVDFNVIETEIEEFQHELMLTETLEQRENNK